MSIVKKAFRGAAWLALFRAASQTFSWVATVIVARLLVPEDFGLMEMATILTGYVILFNELGLGAAIIQREKINDDELSSLFWFVFLWGCLLGVLCLFLAYPTVAIFKQEEIFRVTQSVSLLFVINSLLIVPRNVLHRELRFKAIGFIDASSIIISCMFMIVVAKLGGGVWTLIGGHIFRAFIQVILTLVILSWRPRLHFDINEIKIFVKYGLKIAVANSLYYIYTKSDRFFGGRLLGPVILGYYSMALQLASIPTDKLVSLVNSVSFPVFSRYQNSDHEFNDFFLKIVNAISFITFPIYIGAYFIADQLIPVILGLKWVSIIFPFKLLCIAQLIVSVTSVNGVVLNAKGVPHWNVYVNILNVLILPASFYMAAKHGLNYLALPLLTLQPLIRLVQLRITIRLLTVSVWDYFKSLLHPLMAVTAMLFMLFLGKFFYYQVLDSLFTNSIPYLILIIALGGISYATYITLFHRGMLVEVINMFRNKI